MWWQRKPVGSWLGAPPKPKNTLIPQIVTVLTIALALMLPMVGATLLLILLSSGGQWLYHALRHRLTPVTR